MFRFLVVFLSVLFISNIAKADFAKGLNAYDEGNYAIAFEEWGMAADKGDVAAQRNLGHLYRWGKGTDKNPGKAAYWYLKAAKAGFDRAQYNIAMMYLKGEGVPQDFYESVRWLKLSANQKYKPAVEKLEELKKQGRDVDEVNNDKNRKAVSIVGFEKTDYDKNLKIEKQDDGKVLAKVDELKSNTEIQLNNVLYDDNDYYLHVGSYISMDNGDKDWKKVTKKYGLNPDKYIYQRVKVKGVTYARLPAFGNGNELKEACYKMKRNKVFCHLYDENLKRVR